MTKEELYTGERRNSNFYELNEQFKERCTQLQAFGIEVVNLQKDLAHMQSQTRKLYEEAEKDAEKKTESYQRFILRIIDILSDLNQMPREKLQEDHNSLTERLRRTLLVAIGKADSSNSRSGHKRESTNPDEMKPELRYLKTILLDALKGEGVNAVDVECGTLFDPAIHEVSGKITDSKLPAGAIVRMVEPGYVQGQCILRKAKVVITQGKVAS